MNRERPDLRVQEVQPLLGGYWNDVMRIETDQGPMVLKHYRAVMPGTLFPNLPDEEARALTRLSGTNVAPEPVGYWPQDGVLIYRFVTGDPWDGDLDAVSGLLNRKSRVDPAGFRKVPMTPEDILYQADELFAACSEDGLTRHLRTLRPEPVGPPRAGWCDHPQLCHTDIGALNLIGNGVDLRLIDWQCPAAGDGAEDVYTFLSPAFQILNLRAPLSQEARLRFLTGLDDREMLLRFMSLEPFFAWRMAGYCCRRMQSADDPLVRDRYTRAARAEADLISSLTC